LHERAQAQRSKLLTERLQKMPPGQVDELIAALPALEALAARLQKPAGQPAGQTAKVLR